MKIIKQNYRVVSEKGSYSLKIWLLEILPMEKVSVLRIDKKIEKLEIENFPKIYANR